MTEKLDVRTMRYMLNQVLAYRNLKKSVQQSGKHNFVWGLIFFAIWYQMFNGQVNINDLFNVFYFTLSCTEIGVGVLKFLWPTAECLLLDSVILFLFAALNAVRALLIYINLKRLDVVSIAIGLYMGYQGLNTVQAYVNLRRLFTSRPSAENIAYVNDLLKEIRNGDPSADHTMMHFGKLRAKVLDDMLILIIGPTVIVYERPDVTIELGMEDKDAQSTMATLIVEGERLTDFKLQESTWKNFKSWKGISR